MSESTTPARIKSVQDLQVHRSGDEEWVDATVVTDPPLWSPEYATGPAYGNGRPVGPRPMYSTSARGQAAVEAWLDRLWENWEQDPESEYEQCQWGHGRSYIHACGLEPVEGTDRCPRHQHM